MSSLTFSVIYVCSEPEKNSVDMSDVTGENELIASLKLYPPVSFIKELCSKHCKCLGMQYRLKETIVLRVLNQDFHFYILILEFKLNIQHCLTVGRESFRSQSICTLGFKATTSQ